MHPLKPFIRHGPSGSSQLWCTVQYALGMRLPFKVETFPSSSSSSIALEWIHLRLLSCERSVGSNFSEASIDQTRHIKLNQAKSSFAKLTRDRDLPMSVSTVSGSSSP